MYLTTKSHFMMALKKYFRTLNIVYFHINLDKLGIKCQSYQIFGQINALEQKRCIFVQFLL